MKTESDHQLLHRKAWSFIAIEAILHITTYSAGFWAGLFSVFPKDLFAVIGLSSFCLVAGLFFPLFAASNWFILIGIRMVTVLIKLLYLRVDLFLDCENVCWEGSSKTSHHTVLYLLQDRISH
jgi:hypothetical protein